MKRSQEAPGALEAVRAFVNTIDVSAGADVLRTPQSANAWLAETGLEGRVASAQGLERLVAFRAALIQLLAFNGGGGNGQDAWPLFASALRGVHLETACSPAGELSLRPAGHDELATIGVLAAAVYDAVRSGQWSRLKLCRDGGCAWAFYDRSKNGSGSWCSMEGCGNRNKARRRRQKEHRAPA